MIRLIHAGLFAFTLTASAMAADTAVKLTADDLLRLARPSAGECYARQASGQRHRRSQATLCLAFGPRSGDRTSPRAGRRLLRGQQPGALGAVGRRPFGGGS